MNVKPKWSLRNAVKKVKIKYFKLVGNGKYACKSPKKQEIIELIAKFHKLSLTEGNTPYYYNI